MNLLKIIGELRRDKERLDGVIGSLEGRSAVSVDGTVPARKRRGRKSMSPEERREVSARAKKYWADRRR